MNNAIRAYRLLTYGLVSVLLSGLVACDRGNTDDGGGGGTPAAVITAQPTDQSVIAGSTATFSVAANNASGYQWQRSTDGGTSFSNLAGATLASYTTPPTTLADSGQRFRVIVAGAANSVTSSAVTLTVTPAPIAPSITVHPADQTVTAGQTASFSVTATGTSLGYQWQRSIDGGTTYTNVSGATASSYTTPATAATDSGQRFRVVVSNSVGSVTSNAATLTVNAAPVAPAFTAHPANASVVAPDAAIFSVTVTGTPVPTLQWQLSTDSGANWSDIALATAASYTTPATAATDSGRQYRAVATNSAGSTNSNAATLTVTAPVAPAFTAHPADVTVTEPAAASFSVTVTGTPTPTLQWQLSTDSGTSWSNINGATAVSYTTPATAASDSGRQYRAVATNSAGSTNSNAATLTVNAVPATNAVLVSATPAGVVANAPSRTPSVSADGRWIAFANDLSASTPINLVGDGFGGGAFLHDRTTSANTRINVRPDGSYSPGMVRHLKLAADARHALFTSFANDLVAGDTNIALDVFVRDLQTGVTTRENVLPDGSQDAVSGNASHPFPPDISADGRWVLMWSQVNLAGDGASVGQGLFLRDRQTGVTRAVVPNGTALLGASLSASGQFVVYAFATGSGTSYAHHLDVYNIAAAATTRLLDVALPSGVGGIHIAMSVSDDGRFVAIGLSSQTLLGTTDYQVVLFDRSLADPVAGREIVSVTDDEVPGSGGSSTRPQLSGDGRYVLFASRAANLRVEPFSDTLLVRDRQLGTTRVASRRIDGTPASGGIGLGSEALSRDGSTVVFMGEMSKIVDPASSAGWQVFRVGRP
jgi:hypothetical protein